MKKIILTSLLMLTSLSVFSVEYNKVPRNVQCLQELGTTICNETSQEAKRYYDQYQSVVSCVKPVLFKLTSGEERYAYFKVLGLGNGTFSRTIATQKARINMNKVEEHLFKVPYCTTLFN